MKSNKKSEYSVYRFDAQKFSNIETAKKCISECLVGSVTTIGYIIPGHGFKGKQQVINVDSDLSTMYAINYGKREVILWCIGELNEETKSRKRAREDEDKENASTAMPKSKTGKKMQEVNNIMAKLKEKHESQYSVEKLSAWAHMINMKTHESYDSPPNYPYFRNTKIKRTTPKTQSTTPATRSTTPETQSSVTPATLSPATIATPTVTLSPYKRIQYRSECMDQLNKWHSLLKNGIINEEQYKTMQSSILDDITKLC
jgi:hypothetical protein